MFSVVILQKAHMLDTKNLLPSNLKQNSRFSKLACNYFIIAGKIDARFMLKNPSAFFKLVLIIQFKPAAFPLFFR